MTAPNAGGANARRPEHWLTFPSPGMIEHRWEDGTEVAYRDPSVSFEDGRVTALLLGKMAGARSAEVFDLLRNRMLETNPLQFYMCVDALLRVMRRAPIEAAHGYDVLVEFVGGILTSLPADQVMQKRAALLTEEDFTEMEILVREFARLDLHARITDLAEDDDERNIDARGLLVGEQQFDRTAGYTQHLSAIADQVLARLDGVAATGLGFDPRDALRAARAHATAQHASLVDAADRRRSGPAHSAMRSTHSYDVLTSIAEAMSRDPRSTLVESLGMDPASARHLLDALSTPLGDQDVTSLTSANRLRQFPVIKFEDGTYIWASPHDFVHDALDWADLHLVGRRIEPARRRLLKGRARVAEKLVAAAFADVFGAERVRNNVQYEEPSGEWIESDLLVDLGGAVVVVEVKSHRITLPGRQANAARVRSKVEEFLLRPLEQTDRARKALMAGCEIRDARGQQLGRMRAPLVRRVIVHLDRVDPFVTYAHEIADDLSADAWIVSVADLLAVTELLRSPTELYGYISARAAQIAGGSPLVFMESDALGAWLRSREGAWPVEDGAVFRLAYSSDEINKYFTQSELHARHPDLASNPIAPRSGIPPLVLETMTQLIGHLSWPTAVSAIAAVPPHEWEKFARDVRRATAPVRTRQQRRARASTERGTSYGTDKRLVVRFRRDRESTIRVDDDGRIVLTICVATDQV